MRMHRVEVDDEVFSLVKAHAEPLVDNFNSALRRLLPLGANSLRRLTSSPEMESKVGTSNIASWPSGTPQALRQILEVVQLVRGGAYTRPSATQYVAKQLNVAPQTVLDKYTRQLGLTARQFDRLLDEEDLTSLRNLLNSKLPLHTEVINTALR